MRITKDLIMIESLQHDKSNEIPQQDTIRIIPYLVFCIWLAYCPCVLMMINKSNEEGHTSIPQQ
ncbi:MAG: hypothetical protein OEM89_07950 [Nitrosopumilus sp.]|nr:hypothetical protein [Nitrosopumilus sp.]